MNQALNLFLTIGFFFAVSACGGDQKDSSDRAAEAQNAIQQGLQKEQKMIEGMVKGVETVEKKAAEAKTESKR